MVRAIDDHRANFGHNLKGLISSIVLEQFDLGTACANVANNHSAHFKAI